MSEEQQPKSSSLEGVGKRKRKSKPTSKTRSKRQKTKDRYMHAREDAQLEGLIPTTPEEGLKQERVPSSVQKDQPLPGIIGRAIRNGWAVPELRKPDLVDELIRILDDPEIPAKVKVAAFNALRQADQAQYERDHPEAMAKIRGATSASASVNVSVNSVQSNIEAAAIVRAMIERGELGLLETVQPSHQPGAPGDGR